MRFDHTFGRGPQHAETAVMAKAGPPGLLDDEALTHSEVVANSSMNRERGLTGPNSYAKELGFDPWQYLVDRCRERPANEPILWLDLCCGSGRALIEGAERATERTELGRLQLIGVDLMPMFREPSPPYPQLRLIAASLNDWDPAPIFARGSGADLITCVHGLHYLGDKLGFLSRALSWLKPDGLLLAHLDPHNLRLENSAPNPRPFLSAFRRAGVEWLPARKLIRATGRRDVTFPFHYLGADDTAGSNHTGQPAVGSWYRPSASAD